MSESLDIAFRAFHRTQFSTMPQDALDLLLRAAIALEHPLSVTAIVEAGASLTRLIDQQPPLAFAVRSLATDCVDSLIAAGADVTWTQPRTRHSLYHLLVKSDRGCVTLSVPDRRRDIGKLLLEAGLPLATENRYGVKAESLLLRNGVYLFDDLNDLTPRTEKLIRVLYPSPDEARDIGEKLEREADAESLYCRTPKRLESIRLAILRYVFRGGTMDQALKEAKQDWRDLMTLSGPGGVSGWVEQFIGWLADDTAKAIASREEKGVAHEDADAAFITSSRDELASMEPDGLSRLLCRAIALDYPESTRRLIKAGASKKRKVDGLTPLAVSALYAAPSCTRVLIQLRAKLDCVSPHEGGSLYHLCCGVRRPHHDADESLRRTREIIDLLYAAGLSLELENSHGTSARRILQRYGLLPS